jgi:hypothetical protein
MRAVADDLARVLDATTELLLSHTATVTGELKPGLHCAPDSPPVAARRTRRRCEPRRGDAHVVP